MPGSLVWWLDEDGKERVELATPDLRSESFHVALMARHPKAYPGMRNRHGRYWFASSEQHVWHESLFEATALLWLDFDGDVRSIASQPMKLVFGSGAEHFPDFFAVLRTGEQVLIDVRARTRLVVVDELHNLKLRTSGSGEGVDFLKGLSNQLHATFVYVGIALNDSELFSGDRGRQITGRFISAPLRPFTLATQEDKVLWREVIEAFESNLCLASQRPGDLEALSEYLYERTGGSIGSLGRLLTGTAAWLIYRGGHPNVEERLTKRLLDETTLDIAAESFTLQRAASSGKSPLRGPAVESPE